MAEKARRMVLVQEHHILHAEEQRNLVEAAHMTTDNPDRHAQAEIEDSPSCLITGEVTAGHRIVGVTPCVQHQRQELPVVQWRTEGHVKFVVAILTGFAKQRRAIRCCEFVTMAIPLNLLHQLSDVVGIRVKALKRHEIVIDITPLEPIVFGSGTITWVRIQCHRIEAIRQLETATSRRVPVHQGMDLVIQAKPTGCKSLMSKARLPVAAIGAGTVATTAQVIECILRKIVVVLARAVNRARGA
mmetsp:Transcript_102173/g.256116  ORF Transcript_102173/g.256116 Transcript_102173/m.256116 type:complete len:244 (-) Transcript_102173:412-1143(-)